MFKSRFLPALAAALLFAAALVLGTDGRVHAATPTAGNHGAHHGGANGCTFGSPESGMAAMHGTMSTPPAGMMMTGEADLIFIDMMIPHHESAVAMAKIALERAEHQEVRDLAQAIIAGQQAEIERMRAWRDAWYPGAPAMPMDQMMRMMSEMVSTMPAMMGTPAGEMATMMGGSGMNSMMDPDFEARALCDTAGPFDQVFLQMMIPHHQSAIVMAEVVLERAVHAEIAQLARAIIDAQTHEIGQMTGWLRQWYGVTPAAMGHAGAMAQDVPITLSEFGVTTGTTAFRTGQTYRFVVTNHGQVNHEFMVMPAMAGMGQMEMEELDAMSLGMIPADELPPGATRTLEVTFTSAGSYELVCAVPGHYNAGMTTTVTVA